MTVDSGNNKVRQKAHNPLSIGELLIRYIGEMECHTKEKNAELQREYLYC